MKLRTLVTALSLFSLLSHGARAACPKPWVFFDLGNTIVDTKTNDYNPMFYLKDVAKFADGDLYRDAKGYVDALVKNGFTVGLITDVPADWGTEYPAGNPLRDFMSAKVLRTMDFVAGTVADDKTSWQGEAMDWKPFGSFAGTGADRVFNGTIFLPRNDSERKHDHSTAMFIRALDAAKKAGCGAVFEGEVEDEMVLAETAGLQPFRVGFTDKANFYLPVGQIRKYQKDYVPGRWK